MNDVNKTVDDYLNNFESQIKAHPDEAANALLNAFVLLNPGLDSIELEQTKINGFEKE